MNKVESRYVEESSLPTDKSGSGSGMELWSAESELSIWPTARQLERKFINVACRAVVLNESIYQRVASANVTTASALNVHLQVQQRSRSSSIPSDRSSSGQVSASIASSQHSRDSYSAASKGNWSSPLWMLSQLVGWQVTIVIVTAKVTRRGIRMFIFCCQRGGPIQWNLYIFLNFLCW